MTDKKDIIKKHQDIIKRRDIKDGLISILEQTVDQRVERYLEIDHQGIVGSHYFAKASSECIDLYRDGYYISAVMVSQAVNEGILKFIAESNGIEKKAYDVLLDEFMQKSIMTSGCVQASKEILGSFRNDVHHMNPKVAKIPFQQLARKNLKNLATIEKEIFGTDFNNGELVPHHPKYWDIQKGGTVPVFLRLG